MTQWIDPSPVEVSPDLRAAVGGHPLLAETLSRRGFSSVERALSFLDPALYRPADPYSLPDLPAAVDRIRLAVRRAERIAIWGDFDADGQTATALLIELFRALGADVLSRVPSRERGHGIQPSDVDELAASGARLIVTCDTGVTAHEAIARAQDQGIDTIVTDHHIPADTLPPALAVVNPHRLPPGHPAATLSGVAVAYQLEQALRPATAGQSLDIVAIGLLADVSTLVGDARYLVQRGIQALRHTGRPGLQAIYNAAEIRADGIDENHVGFVLAPRLNALGRLADAALGVELLTTKDPARARILAFEVEGLNSRRQWLTRQITDAALAEIQRKPNLLTDYSALVLSHPSWPAGVIGIVASRLAERFGRPAVLIATPPGSHGSGSGRSVPGIDLVAALKECAPLLGRYGGHAGAAGFSIEVDRIAEFRAALSRAVDQLAAAVPEPVLQIDEWLGLPDLTLDLVASTSRLAPFGRGNLPLTLAVRDVRVTADAVVGRTLEHRRLVVEDPSGNSQTVFWWNGAGWPLPRSTLDLALTIRASDYRGQSELQVEWIEARSHEQEVMPLEVPRIAVSDLRFVPDPATALLQVCSEGALQVWAEGQAITRLPRDLVGLRQDVIAGGRHQLAACQRLAIWSLPPGPSELKAVLGHVRPETVVAFSVDPGLADLHSFLERVAGMCKFALHERGGQVGLEAAAVAAAHRRETVMAGIELLASQGKLVILDRGPHMWQIEGRVDASAATCAQAALNRLIALVDETAAYRNFLYGLSEQALASYLAEAAAASEE